MHTLVYTHAHTAEVEHILVLQLMALIFKQNGNKNDNILKVVKLRKIAKSKKEPVEYCL
jgi:hypothetical protein